MPASHSTAMLKSLQIVSAAYAIYADSMQMLRRECTACTQVSGEKPGSTASFMCCQHPSHDWCTPERCVAARTQRGLQGALHPQVHVKENVVRLNMSDVHVQHFAQLLARMHLDFSAPQHTSACTSQKCALQAQDRQANQFSLEGAAVRREAGQEHVFTVWIRETRQQFRLRAASEEDCTAWLLALKAAVDSGPRVSSSSPTVSEVSAISSPPRLPANNSRSEIATPTPTPPLQRGSAPGAASAGGRRNDSASHAVDALDDGGTCSPTSDVGTEYTYMSAGSAALPAGRDNGGAEAPPPIAIPSSGEQILLSPLNAAPDVRRLPGHGAKNRCAAPCRGVYE